MTCHFLDWVARAYFWFYHHLLQRSADEPITRQSARIVQRWPALCWGIALVILGLSAAFLRGWWLLVTAAIYLFAWWWFGHILEYCVVHRDDNPIYRAEPSVVDKAEHWAARRIRERNGNRNHRKTNSDNTR